jgi:hypothetical protein
MAVSVNLCWQHTTFQDAVVIIVMEFNVRGEDGGFMITCSKCGAMIEGNPMTCPECGAQIVQDAGQPIDSYSSTDSEKENPIGLKYTESSSEKTIIVQHKDILVRILLFILVVCAGYLVFSKFREKNSSENIDSSNRVLVVYMNSDSSTNQSDMTQIKNAFNNGGMIKLDPNDISTDLKLQMESYGAADADGMYWVTGAVLNYIASRGWNLVQAPTTGLVNCYYFTR